MVSFLALDAVIHFASLFTQILIITVVANFPIPCLGVGLWNLGVLDR